jgi:hypothetical protein
LANGKAESEVAVVVSKATCVLGVGAVEQSNLTKHRVPIDKHLMSDAEVIIPQPSGTGDINQKISIFEPLPSFPLSGPMERAIGSIAVDPRLSEVKVGKDLFERAKGEGAVIGNRARNGVVGPSA